ncbi:gliding motility-associated C-terminal domain-containing protein [Niastella yeongjuensis]|uniref:T9SS type B sorting domain-containing protein n=1 Tax=Niastella yeongjuensis TaxID=354355 RepID=UPI0013FDE8FF|nr:gliding motility-associated C-terminal domain-containing protein [Niastella yeongjuensis]
MQLSNNPTTCHGSEGSITFSGLVPNTTYQVMYLENNVQKGPVTLLTDGTGQLVIPNLTMGAYRNFTFIGGGTTLSYVAGTPLSDPILPPPVFSFSSIIICLGDPAPALPATSNNGYTGSWSPAVIDPNQSGTYTFTPSISCADPVTITVTVIQKQPVTFPFGPGLVLCGTGAVPILTNTSNEGVTGTWNPAVIDPTHSGTYVFTPTVPPPGCLTGTIFTLVVNPPIMPTFSFPGSESICTGGSVPTLPNQSQNGITGNWIPAVVDPNNSGTYTFTPDPGQCALPATYTLTVKPIIPPVFSSFPNSKDTICDGDPAPVLPAASDIGQTGTWTPAVVSNTKSGTYVFTSTSDPCAPPTTVTITVKPILTPEFTFSTSQSVCINVNPPVLPGVSTNGVNGTWSPAVVDNQNTGMYTFTPATGQCAVDAMLNYEVNPIPSIINLNLKNQDTVTDGDVLPYYDFPVDIPVTGINWTNNNTAIGLQASGAGTVPSFTATNMTNDPITGTVTAIPYVNGCMGAAQSYKIIVKPRFKDIYVPNVFSPDGKGDPRNEVFKVYGNYIATLELHIFNQWGQKMITITDPNQGWDGRFKGSPQPVGVYVYVLKATTTDGRTLSMKGSITLVR